MYGLSAKYIQKEAETNKQCFYRSTHQERNQNVTCKISVAIHIPNNITEKFVLKKAKTYIKRMRINKTKQ